MLLPGAARQVCARAEASARPRDHEHPDIVVVLRLVQRVVQLSLQLAAQRIQLLGPIQRDHSHVLLAIEIQHFVGHCGYFPQKEIRKLITTFASVVNTVTLIVPGTTCPARTQSPPTAAAARGSPEGD